jgi:hypothetical protein
MKTLSLFMSLVLFITFNASAGELMKFGTNVKKSKRVEQAKANQKKYSRDYIIQLRQAHINFLIKLENDINAGHLTSAESQKLIDRAWSILVMSNAYAAAVAALKDGDICFIGGRESKIKGGLCAVPPGLREGCPQGQLSCDPKLFGEGTCAPAKSSYGGLTANCAKNSEGKIDQIVKGFEDNIDGIKELQANAKKFCDNWIATKTKAYDGCDQLQDRVAQIEKDETARLAQIEADRLKKLEEDKDDDKRVVLGGGDIDNKDGDEDGDPKKEHVTPAPKITENNQNGEFDASVVPNAFKGFTGGGASNEGDGLAVKGCFPQNSFIESNDLVCDVDEICKNNNNCNDTNGFKTLLLPPKGLNFNRAYSCIPYLSESEVDPNLEPELGGDVVITQNDEILRLRACRAIAASCIPKNMPRNEDEAALSKQRYNTCVSEETEKQKRSVIVGIKKCRAIEMAAQNTTNFNPAPDIKGKEISCVRNDDVELRGGGIKRGGIAFDYPSCKSFYAWYTALMVSEKAMDVTNESIKVNQGIKAQQEHQAEIAQGNGQSAGIDASKKVTISAAEAEERKAIFLVGKSAAITAKLATFKTPNNVCKSSCCDLFKKKSKGDQIKGDYFPNSAVKGIIIAKMVDAGAKAAIAGMNAKALRDQAALMAQVKDQLQFDDGTGPEGVMKFCVENPHDVRCLGPGDRRPLNATNYGSQFGGANMGLGSLGTDMGEDFAIDPSQGGSLGAAKKSVSDIGGMNKDAAAAKDIFNAPGGGGGGGGGMGGPQGGGGGGGGGGGATANRLSDDPGADSEVKKENPIEINKKTASLEGGKAYTGGSWRAGSNNKKDAVAANPFASMFGKKQGRDPANVPEIDKPASDLFAKISHRYGEVQKRKGLLEIGSEGADGGNAKDGLR